MKRTIILTVLALMLAFSPVDIEAQNFVSRNSIKYISEKNLLVRGDEVNVVDVQLEWPEKLNYDKVEGLKKYISETLFGKYTGDVDRDKADFLRKYGEKLKSKFDTIPDDNKFCYVTCSATEMGFVPGKFISYRLELTSQPQSKSSQKAIRVVRMLTYDLINNKLWKESDIMDVASIINNPFTGDAFQQYLSRGMRSNKYDYVPASSVLGPAPVSGQTLAFEVFNDSLHYDVLCDIPFSVLKETVSRKFRKMMLAEPALAVQVPESVDSVSLERDVYTSPEVMPAYGKSRADIAEYFSHNYIIPLVAGEVEKAGKKVVASFIIEKDGSVGNVRIIVPASPSADRAFVRALVNMPKWTPGSQNGETVRTLCYQTIKLIL